VTSMTDPTTGFLAARRDLLNRLDLDPVGWKIVLEVVVKAAPVRVAEVPIIFVDRELGVSKQSLGVFSQYLTHLAKLYAHRYPSLAELVKFCLVGVFGLCVDLATVIALKEKFALDTRLCAVAGFTVAVTSNFVLNRKYTFARARELPLLFSYATYVGTSLAGLAIRMLTIQALIAMAGMDEGRSYVFTNFVGIILATLVNFVGAKYFAFDPERIAFPNPDEVPSKRPSSMPPRARNWGIALLFSVCLGYAFISTVPGAELQSPDEGVNVTMAKNIQRSWDFFVRPSVYPGGRSDWLHEDLPALGNLPTYPALLALAPKWPGFSGMALVSWLALCVVLYSTVRLVALVDSKAAMYTGILMVCSPALLLAYRRIEFEPVLTAFCAAGLYQFVRGTWQRQRLRCFLGGALLGLGFAVKMWLIVPYAFAFIAFCVVEAAAVRSSGTSAGLRKGVAVGTLGFAISAAAHLGFVAIASPHDLPAWLGSVYLGIFSGRGVTGGKLSALADYAHHEHSALYYPWVLYRDHFFLLPLTLYGLGELLRVPQLRRSRLLAMILGALVALVVLSVPAYKEPHYVLAVQPFLYAFAGLCVAAFARSPDKLRPATISVVRASMLLSIGAFLVVALVYALGGPIAISAPYVIAHGFGTLLCLLLGELWMRSRFVTRPFAILSLVGLLAFAIAHRRVAEPVPYGALAAVLRPQLNDSRQAYPSFLARDAEILQGYLDHAGLRFEDLANDPARAAADPDLKAFVIAEEESRLPQVRELLDWLDGHTREITPAVVAKLGKDWRYRVFIR
jgi:putative flippase GtrA